MSVGINFSVIWHSLIGCVKQRRFCDRIYSWLFTIRCFYIHLPWAVYDHRHNGV